MAQAGTAVEAGVFLALQLHLADQGLDLLGFQLHPAPLAQLWRQCQIAKANSHQSGHIQILGLEQTAHFPVFTPGQRHLVPVVGALFRAAGIFDAVEFGHTIFEQHAIEHGLALFRGHAATDAHCVLTDEAIGRVHQAMRQLPVGGEQQQPGGIDVQTPYLHPAHALQAWQIIKHRGASFRIVARTHFAGWLMVHDHALNNVFFRLHFNNPAIHT